MSDGKEGRTPAKISRRAFAGASAMAALAAAYPFPAAAQDTRDWMSGLPRETVHVKAWPGGKKVAVAFVLYVEVWGVGHGPNLRNDMVGRSPDVVNEAFRQYAIEWGLPRIGRLFRDEGVPISLALNALMPSSNPQAWKELRAAVPDAPILGHGLNNSTQLLPLNEGVAAQQAYIRRTLDLIQKETGQRPTGWSSPSVYPNAGTFLASAAEGVRYTLDGMDSDVLTRLRTPTGPLLQIPYPTTTVDMGHYLTRNMEPVELEKLWVDYITELVREASADAQRDATVVAIGIHPFVMGTPTGAAAMRRVLEAVKKLDLVWMTDTQAIFDSAS
ncbi:MAG: polysaccharide deacetylase [Proteobacteria bacterium]|nr:polysaccharide deacetylase [Pseudomonadota bacterium]